MEAASEPWMSKTWQEPHKTVGKGFMIWEELKANNYFVLQRHRMEGSGVSGFFKIARRTFTSHTCLLRIVINTFPFPLIAESDDANELDESWKFLEEKIVHLLEEMPKGSWYYYALGIAAELAKNKEPSILKGEATKGTLEEENEDPGPDMDMDDPMCCKICLSAKAVMAVTPCGHLVSCKPCFTSVGSTFPVCPMCRGPVASVIRIYT